MLRISDVDTAKKQHPWASRSALLCFQPSQPHRQGQRAPSLSGRGARGAVVLLRSFREKISCPVSHGGRMAVSMPRSAAWLPTPRPPLLQSWRLQGGEHRTGLSEQVCSPSPLLSSPLPDSLKAAPAEQTDPGLGPTCSYETSFHSIISVKLNFQLHLIQN